VFFSRLLRLPVFISTTGKNATPKRSTGGRIEEVAGFGTNPGALRMRVYSPTRLRASRPLVVAASGVSGRDEETASFNRTKKLDRVGFDRRSRQGQALSAHPKQR